MPTVPEDRLIDPRITEAISQFAGLDAEAERNETTGEGMDIDDDQDSDRQREVRHAADDH